MLKIKNSVDLKELKKFGFLKETNKNRYSKLIFSKNSNDYYIFIKSNRNIDLRHYSNDYSKLNDMTYYADTLYDLIKADMVEKVEE